MFFQAQKFGSVEYNGLSLTERSSLLAWCFGKYNILHLLCCLPSLLIISGQYVLFPQISIRLLLKLMWLMRRVLRMRMLSIRKVYYLPVQIYWPVHVWSMTHVSKLRYFLSNQIYLKESKQCGYIRVLSYAD